MNKRRHHAGRRVQGLILALCTLLFVPAAAQESILKDYAHAYKEPTMFYPICLYPSTLRMINVANDPSYNELVNDIEKLLIYNLDSAAIAEGSYTWMTSYEQEGYEEYIALYGEQQIRIIGKDDEMVGLVDTEERVFAFYLRGEIGLEALPKLVSSFNSDDFLDIIKDQF